MNLFLFGFYYYLSLVLLLLLLSYSLGGDSFWRGKWIHQNLHGRFLFSTSATTSPTTITTTMKTKGKCLCERLKNIYWRMRNVTIHRTFVFVCGVLDECVQWIRCAMCCHLFALLLHLFSLLWIAFSVGEWSKCCSMLRQTRRPTEKINTIMIRWCEISYMCNEEVRQRERKSGRRHVWVCFRGLSFCILYFAVVFRCLLSCLTMPAKNEFTLAFF